ncbi:hypothetical protein TWF730_004024 [Orbilia blumenaviensis]|uniref:Uncharacterized protein n=1 Tax=Orbilia blumenaviensis TaxID=1796055 RepID=A0AAV9U5E6_9PEZI
MTLSPRSYAAGEKPFPTPPAPPPVGGIQDEMPVGAGMLNSTQQHYQPPGTGYPAAAPASKKTFTFTRKTVIIIAVVVVIIIGALVGGLVGGLRSKSSGNSTPSDSGSQTSDPNNTGASNPARTSSSSRDTDTSSRGIGATTSSSSRPTSTGIVPDIDTLRGTGGSENAYPTTATYSIIGASGISGISPTPFPGFDETISSASLLTNGDFKSGDLDGWTDADSCWQVRTDPSTTAFSPLEKSATDNRFIARNTADDLSGGRSCNLTQIVSGVQPGTLELSFLWGHYERDEDTWFYVSAGSTIRPLVILAMQDTPGFSRTLEWTKSAYSFEFEGGDFVVTFSAHSKVTSHDVAQVQLIRT